MLDKAFGLINLHPGYGFLGWLKRNLTHIISLQSQLYSFWIKKIWSWIYRDNSGDMFIYGNPSLQVRITQGATVVVTEEKWLSLNFGQPLFTMQISPQVKILWYEVVQFQRQVYYFSYPLVSTHIRQSIPWGTFEICARCARGGSCIPAW